MKNEWMKNKEYHSYSDEFVWMRPQDFKKQEY